MGEFESRLGGLENMSSKKRLEGGESMGNDLFSLYIFLSEGTDTCESLELGKSKTWEKILKRMCVWSIDFQGEQGIGGAASWAESQVPGLCELCSGVLTSCNGSRGALAVLQAGDRHD